MFELVSNVALATDVRADSVVHEAVLLLAEQGAAGAALRQTRVMTFGTSHPAVADRLFDHRIVMMVGEVTDELAHRVVGAVLALSLADPATDIVVAINSPGGSVTAGLAIYDVIQLVPNDVVTVAVGFAASMGQIVLCGGTAGKRFAFPNAQVVMHEGSAGLGGSAADVAIQAANLVDTLDRMRRIIARHTGRTIDDVVAEVGRDRWFDAEAALDYGFVDHIVISLDEMVATPLKRPLGLAGLSA